MPNKWIEGMSADMKASVPKRLALEEEILRCHSLAHKAKESIKNKGQKSEDGKDVLNGSINLVEDIIGYWIDRRDASIKMYVRLLDIQELRSFEMAMYDYGITVGVYGGKLQPKTKDFLDWEKSHER